MFSYMPKINFVLIFISFVKGKKNSIHKKKNEMKQTSTFPSWSRMKKRLARCHTWT